MKTVIEFLKELQRNNNRVWFEANRTRYREAAEQFAAFVERLIVGIAGFDPSIGNLSAADCTYRIYRDTRFSLDKSPYKTHMGAYICPHGKRSGYAGYYFHIEPTGSGFVGGHLLSAGLYRPSPEILRGVREEIRDNGQDFIEALEQASGFALCHDNTLKKIPNGFPADSPYAEYFKLKDFFLERYVNERFMCMKEERLLARTLEQFRTAQPFNAFLNRAIDLVRSERE